jgi:hypothetical protein
VGDPTDDVPLQEVSCRHALQLFHGNFAARDAIESCLAIDELTLHTAEVPFTQLIATPILLLPITSYLQNAHVIFPINYRKRAKTIEAKCS